MSNILSKNNMGRTLTIALAMHLIFISQASGSESSTAYEYHQNGNLIKIDGPRLDVDDITLFEYHGNASSKNFGKIKTIINAKNQRWVFEEYSPLGKPELIIDPNGVKREYTFDQNGNPARIKIESPNNEFQVIDYTFNDDGRLESVRHPSGMELFYSRNSLGWITEISNNLGEKIEYEYDDAGNVVGEAIRDDGSQIRWTIEKSYDELNRLRASEWSTGKSSEIQYDETSRRISSINSYGESSQLIFDEMGRPTTKSLPDGGEIQLGYNHENLISSLKDPNNNTTNFIYDGLGNLVELQSPDTGTSRYEHDQVGNLTKAIDGRGIVSEFRYDALNRLVRIIYPAKTDENVEYVYDETEEGRFGVGNLTSIQFGGGSIQYFYNYLGQVIRKDNFSDLGLVSTQYQYGAAGLLESITYPSGRIVRYERDALGRIEGIFTRANEDGLEEVVVSETSYLPYGPANYYRYGNGLTHSIEHDLSYRTSRISIGGIDSILDRSYQYDLEDNIKAINNNLDSHKTQNFEYDVAGRLVEADGVYGNLIYSYDKAGNRVTRELNFPSLANSQENYIYSEDSNRLLYVDTYIDGIPSQSREFNYDAMGNRIIGADEEGRDISYEYNHANRLWRVSLGGQIIAEYSYNPLGQRIKKLLSNGQAEHYHYNESGQLIAVMNNEGVSIREYIYRDDEQVAVISRPLSNQSSAQSSSSSSSQSHQLPPPILLDAISAEFSGNHVIATDQQNYTGDGFIDFIGEGSASWELNVPIAGEYLIDVRYAVSGGNRPLDLIVNGSNLHRMSFPSTGSFNSWESVIVKVSLSAGLQTLSLVTTGASGPNVDRLQLQSVQLGAAKKVDESGAGFVGAHLIATNFLGYDGSGFIDVVDEGEVYWPIVVPKEGKYLVRVRYALGAGLRPMNLSLDGQLLSKLNFAPTHTFANWNELLVVVSLPTGSAQLHLNTRGASGPNIDFIELIELNGEEEVPEPPYPVQMEPQLYFIHNDHLGTPQVVTNSNQQVAWMADYLPYGKIANEDNSSLKLFSRFPGQWLDEETGIYHNYFRDYDPSIGRYIQSDPIGLNGGINTFIYASANPLSNVDPLGLFDFRIDGGLIGHFVFGDGETVDLSNYCDTYLNDPVIKQYVNQIMMENYIKSREAGAELNNSSSTVVRHSGRQLNHVSNIYSLGKGYDIYNSNMIVNKDEFGNISYSGSSWIFRYDDYKDPVDLHEFWGLGETPYDKLPNLGLDPFNIMIHCQCLFNQ